MATQRPISSSDQDVATPQYADTQLTNVNEQNVKQAAAMASVNDARDFSPSRMDTSLLSTSAKLSPGAGLSTNTRNSTAVSTHATRPSIHIPCHPNAPDSGAAQKKRIVCETIIHEPQSPMGRPRFSGGNHMEMSVGASTAMMPIPVPSTTRLTMSTPTLSVARPISEPTMAKARAATPAFFGPNRLMIIAAGSAMMMPTKVKMVLSKPAVPMLMPNTSMRTVMMGETLFCTRASDMPPNMATRHTAQPFALVVLVTLMVNPLTFRVRCRAVPMPLRYLLSTSCGVTRKTCAARTLRSGFVCGNISGGWLSRSGDLITKGWGRALSSFRDERAGTSISTSDDH